jgi:CheY-like chemotaxis protein
VDDNPADVGHVRGYLQHEGHRGDVAPSGLEALAQVESGPDVILMNVQMLEMDGAETIERLRADPSTRDVQIIALSSLARDDDRDRCLKAGANDHLSEPVRLRHPLEHINATMDTPSGGLS